ncbi:dephospho-CoA kinase [Vibrio sp.]|nr:dephospho-CoA kinase [Vibrio sp.]
MSVTTPYIVGLTGGIASGKTTVADLFHHHFGIDIVDADVIARQVVEPNTQGLNAICAHFGEAILQSDGTLNRAALRERIFSQPEEKTWLNNLLHPMIRETMITELNAVSSPYGLLVIPLMVENNLQHLADRILVVDVDEETQVSRTMTRDNVPREQALAILKSQATRAQRLAIADDVLENNCDNDSILSKIRELHDFYLTMRDKNHRK